MSILLFIEISHGNIDGDKTFVTKLKRQRQYILNNKFNHLYFFYNTTDMQQKGLPLRIELNTLAVAVFRQVMGA